MIRLLQQLHAGTVSDALGMPHEHSSKQKQNSTIKDWPFAESVSLSEVGWQPCRTDGYSIVAHFA